MCESNVSKKICKKQSYKVMERYEYFYFMAICSVAKTNVIIFAGPRILRL